MAPTRFLPLGDSNMEGVPNTGGGFRAALLDALIAAGKSVDVCGSRSAGPSTIYAPEHAGFPGYKFAQIQGQVAGQSIYRPAIVLVLAGTNNVLGGEALSSLQAAFESLRTALTTSLPSAQICILTLPPIKNAAQEAMAQSYNAWLATRVTSPDLLLDIRALGSLTQADLLADGAHLTPAAYARVGAGLASALLPLLP